MAKFLVIRFSSIGDIVLSTPVIRHLKEQVYGGAEIHFLTKKRFAPLLEANPYLDKVYTIERSTHEVREDIHNEGYDYIIDLHRNIRSKMIKRKTKMLALTIKKYNWEKWLWVNFGMDKMPKNHIVDRYMETIRGFDIKDDGKGLDYFIPEGQTIDMEGKEYIAWALGATHIGKRFSEDKLMEILPLVSKPVILLGGKQEEEIGKRLDKEFSHVSSKAGSLSLHQSASIIKQAKLVLSPDTGMMHIAAAMKKNTISYWGCTHPGLGMYPYMDESKYSIVMPKGGREKPCSKLGDRCKIDKKNPCPNHIEADEIIKEINRFWP